MPVGVGGEVIGDAVMEAAASHGGFEVGGDTAERIGQLRVELLDGRLGGPPLGGQSPDYPAPRVVSTTCLMRPSVPAVVRTSPAVRMAATFWLSAEWVRSTDAPSSKIVIGPRAWRRSNSITKLSVKPSTPASAYRRPKRSAGHR